MRTRLTESLGIEQPVLLAPMDTIAGGCLAAAVSRAGGFGIIGGGYASDESLDSSPGVWRGGRACLAS